MKTIRRTTTMLGATVLLAGAVVPAADARPTGYAAQTQACVMGVDSITAAGNYAGAKVTATSPPTSEQGVGPKGFDPGAVKVSSSWTFGLDAPAGTHDYGYVIIGSTLYSAGLVYDTQGRPTSSKTAVGGGWGNYTAIADSYHVPYLGSPNQRGAFYGLRSDGVISRWTTQFPDGTWSRPTAFTGFSAVKTMALISETATYDSFLAVTHGGALYTIRFPVGSSTAVVKKVRASGWSAFESLVAERCGNYGTLLTGIDKDTGSAYLYAVGHANGTATVIESRGKLPGTYNDPVYYLGTDEGVLPQNGE
jgi:hypothetical protein